MFTTSTKLKQTLDSVFKQWFALCSAFVNVCVAAVMCVLWVCCAFLLYHIRFNPVSISMYRNDVRGQLCMRMLLLYCMLHCCAKSRCGCWYVSVFRVTGFTSVRLFFSYRSTISYAAWCVISCFTMTKLYGVTLTHLDVFA